MQSLNFSSKNIKLTLIDSDITDIEDNEYYIEIIVNKNRLKDILADLLTYEEKEEIEDFDLTKREKQALIYLSSGKNNTQIAAKMNVSVHTAKVHIHNVFSKLSVRDRTQAVIKAIKYKLVDISQINNFNNV